MISVFLYACKKDIVRSTTASVVVVNASPNSNGISFLQNLKELGTFNYLTGLTASTNAITIDSGFHNYKLRAGTNEIANWLYANNGLNYSFFICDSAISSRVKYFFVKDNLDTAGLRNRAYFRLIHVSPDIDSLEVITNSKVNPANDSLLIGNLSYFGKFNQAQLETFGTFFPISGDSTITVKIKRKINSSIAKTYQLRFSKQKIYSLVLKGYDARSGKDSLSLSIITHN